jgi:hypothetical protein
LAFTVADFPALPYSPAMSDLVQMMFPTLKLKQPSTNDIEKAIADGLSKLIGEDQIFSAKISSLEWHSTDLAVVPDALYETKRRAILSKQCRDYTRS